MKRFLVYCFMIALFVSVLATGSQAYNFNAVPPNKMAMIRTTIGTLGAAATITFTSGEAVLYKMRSGSAFTWLASSSTADACYISVPANTEIFSPTYVRIPKNTIWYFTGMAGVSIEVGYWYF